MGLLSGAPAAASLRGTASPALHQRIMTKNFDYDLLLTASVWEAKKDWQRRKSGEASTLPRRSPVLGHRLASFNYGALFFVWFSFVVFATEPTPTSITLPAWITVCTTKIWACSFYDFIFLAGLKCRWHKTHRVLKRLAFARRVPNTAQDGLGFLCSITWLFFKRGHFISLNSTQTRTPNGYSFN